jgi:hypothetical protein
MTHRFRLSIVALTVAGVLACVPQSAKAQASGKTTGAIPRQPDGKTDLTGFWSLAGLRIGHDGEKEDEARIPYTPEGLAAYKNHDDKDDPLAYCLPAGVPRILHSPGPMKIMQSSDHIAMLFELTRIWRLIPTDGRPHHPDVEDTFMGDSVGRWEGDTLVIDTVGFNDRTWLDSAGHQHTSQMRVTERITRTAINNLHYEVTVHDPKFYSKPWTRTGDLKPQAATEGLPEMLEYFCTDNNRDVDHLMSHKPAAGE